MRTSMSSVANFTRALLLCSSLTVVAMAATPASADPANTFTGKYNYCDAVILAHYWGVDPYQAKVNGGTKIESGNASTLKQVMKTARSQSHCGFEDTGFSVDDASLLATYWGRSIDDAKAKVVTFFSTGNSGKARKALNAARTPS